MLKKKKKKNFDSRMFLFKYIMKNSGKQGKIKNILIIFGFGI